MNILLIGTSGYIGSAFYDAMKRRNIPAVAVSREHVDYTDRKQLVMLIESTKPTFVICAAAYIPQPSVDLCKHHKAMTIRANVVLPSMIAHECHDRGIPMGHISTGCLYRDDQGYTEDDPPTRDSFEYAGFYVSTKHVSELLVREYCPNSFVWRIRLPFDNVNSPRNYLTKLRMHETVWDHINSLTHRQSFVNSALDMIERDVPWGVYNMTCRGSISAFEIIEMMEVKMPVKLKSLVPGPVPGTILSTEKLDATGCGMMEVHDAVKLSLKDWVE